MNKPKQLIQFTKLKNYVYQTNLTSRKYVQLSEAESCVFKPNKILQLIAESVLLSAKPLGSQHIFNFGHSRPLLGSFLSDRKLKKYFRKEILFPFGRKLSGKMRVAKHNKKRKKCFKSIFIGALNFQVKSWPPLFLKLNQ